MRIIEGKGPPSSDTFGTSNHLYKDTETGAFYRCHGNINDQRTLPYGPAHKHPGEQYLWTPTDGNGTGGGGQADWNAAEGEAGHVKNRTHYEHLKIIEEASYLLKSAGANKVKVNVGIKNNGHELTLPENRYLYVYVDDLMCVMTSFRISTSYTPVAFEGTDYSFRYKAALNSDRKTYSIEVSETDADLYGKTLRVALVEYELKALDQKFVPNSDWNASEGEAGHVKNRTHWEKLTVVHDGLLNVTWDGNGNGRYTPGENTYALSYIAPLTDDHIKLITETYSDGSVITLSDEWDNMVAAGNVTEDFVVTGSVIYIRKAGVTLYGMTFARPGIYSGNFDGIYVASITTAEPITVTETEVHKLDKKFLPDDAIATEIIFTGVMNEEGWYAYTCDTPYPETREALINGATARMILIGGNEITHMVLRKVWYRDWSVNLDFFDIKELDSDKGIIRYDSDGDVVPGLE